MLPEVPGPGTVPSRGGVWLDTPVERAIGAPAFRVQTLRYIDVLPVLTDDAVPVTHLQDSFAGVELPWPRLGRRGLRHGDAPRAVPVAAPRTARVAVTIDTEHYDVSRSVPRCFRELSMEPGFRAWPAGSAVQACLREAPGQLQGLPDRARARGAPVKVRLVRGAYRDAGTITARCGFAAEVQAT